MITLNHYLALAALLFAISVAGIIINRKNLIVLLMCIELMLLSVNINFVAFSRFLGMLKEEKDIFVSALLVDFERKAGHRGGVPVMTALVGYTGNPGRIGCQITGLLHENGVHISAEGNIRFIRAGAVYRVKPEIVLDNVQFRMLAQERNQMLLGPPFLIRQFRMLMQFMTQLGD